MEASYQFKAPSAVTQGKALHIPNKLKAGWTIWRETLLLPL